MSLDGDTPQTTLDPQGPKADTIHSLVVPVFIIAGIAAFVTAATALSTGNLAAAFTVPVIAIALVIVGYGIWLLVETGFLRGTIGPNQYGPDPLNPGAAGYPAGYGQGGYGAPQGYGQGYRYAHDEPGAYAAGERYLPDEMPDRRYYRPVDRGLEIRIGEALARLRARYNKDRSSGET